MPTAVGSGDLLGCWWFRLSSIAALFCFLMALWVAIGAKLEEYKRRREYENTYCQPNKNPVSALGSLGDANIQCCSGKLKGMGISRSVSKESANLVS